MHVRAERFVIVHRAPDTFVIEEHPHPGAGIVKDGAGLPHLIVPVVRIAADVVGEEEVHHWTARGER